MIILLDTSTPICQLIIVDDGGHRHEFSQNLDRQMARFILKFIEDSLASLGSGIRQISGIGILKGPGSFTGLRIGVAVVNTIADNLAVPIVGEAGSPDWHDRVLSRLTSGENEKIILPFYDRPANITQPKK